MPTVVSLSWRRYLIKRSIFSVDAVVIIAVGALSVAQRSSGHAEWLGIFFIAIGFLTASGGLLMMQIFGLLDQFRLAGQSPQRMLASFVGATSGPWVAMGLLAVAWAHLVSNATQTPLESAAIIASMIATIAIATQLGLERRAVDPGIVGVGMGLLVIGVLAFMASTTGLERLNRTRPAAAPAMLAGGLLAIGWSTRRLLGRLAYPPEARRNRAWGLRLPQRQWLLRVPAWYRGASVALNFIVLIAVFTPLAIIVRLLFPAPTESIALYGLPLLIGLLVVSVLSYEDAISGRLDIFRLSAMHPSRTALEMTLGLWAPFVVVSAVLALLTWALFDVTRIGILVAVAGFALAAPLPVIEGWSRYWVLTYMAPLVMSSVFLMGNWAALLVVSALHWYAVPRKFANPDAPVLSGWRGVAAAATLAAALGVMLSRSSPGRVGMAVVLWLLTTSPLLVDLTATRLQRRAGPIAVGLAGGTMALAGHGLSAGLSIGMAAALTWIGASRIVTLLPARPAAHAIIRLIIVALAMMVVGPLSLTAWADVVNPWLLVPLGVGVCAAAEIAARAVAKVGMGAAADPVIPRS
jgi:hypothetical protein